MYILPDMSDELITDFNYSKQSPTCVGCGLHIYDKYIFRVAPNLEWHAQCLKCVECNIQLDETCTCFLRNGKTYCKLDYTRLFIQKCTNCKEPFSKNDFVMRANNNHIYHVDCFRCSICTKQLEPGAEFCVRDEGLVCKMDNDILDKQLIISPKTSPKSNNTCQNITNLQMPKLKCNDGNDMGSSNTNDSYNNLNHIPTVPHLQPPGPTQQRSFSFNQNHHHHPHHNRKDKTTRVRTVLNEKQLHTLRTCYGANPRPDALMKEQLVEMTGLSPRVIRVWFQNKRCKDKKKNIMLKQMQEQQKNRQSIGHGISMIATSPLQNDISNLGTQNQVDIQTTSNPFNTNTHQTHANSSQSTHVQWMPNNNPNTYQQQNQIGTHLQHQQLQNHYQNNSNMRITSSYDQMMGFGSDEDDCFDNFSDNGDDSISSSGGGLDDNSTKFQHL